MVTIGEVDKLRSIRAPADTVLSLYLAVPRDPAQLADLPARARGLIEAAAAARPARPDTTDCQSACAEILTRAGEWPGQSAAIFACGDLGLGEVHALPAGVADRAVFAARPHLRPLLAALQRHPDHRIVVIDRQHAWLLAVTDGRIETAASQPGDPAGQTARPETGPGTDIGGWYGLDPWHAERPLTDLTWHPYRTAAAALSRLARYGGPEPLVIGGHADGISPLLAELPAELRNCYAGCFAADPHLLTAARARDLAASVLAGWADRREREVVWQVTGPEASRPAAIGPIACLAAVNGAEADLLLIPDDGLVPGYRCERCGVLSMTGEDCCDWGAASRAVPDLLEEMALQTLSDGGDVLSVREVPGGAAARLHQRGG